MILLSLFGVEQGAVIAFSGLMTLFGLAAMGLALTVAYILIAEPQNAPHLPGILGVIQNERRGQSTTVDAASKPAARHPLDDYRRSSAPISGKFRTILSVNEAAEYVSVNPKLNFESPSPAYGAGLSFSERIHPSPCLRPVCPVLTTKL